MKAVVLEKRGRGGIRVGDFPDPEPPPGHAVMRVQAAALNHVDLYMRDSGKGISHELPLILGLDGAGEIVEAPAGSNLKPGMRVIAYPNDFCGRCDYCLAGEQPYCRALQILGEKRHGTYAEYLSMPAYCFQPIPDHVDLNAAAALTVAHLTAWRQVFGKTQLQPHETVLIQGIGGGVALASLELVKLAGATAIVTSSSDEKLNRAKALGADEAINYQKEPEIAKRVMELTHGRGVEMVLDSVGDATWSQSLRSCGWGGRVLVIGATTGGAPPADLQRIFVRQLEIIGSTTGNFAEFRALVRVFAQGRVHPVIDSARPMDEYTKALDRLEAGEQFGKLVITIP